MPPLVAFIRYINDIYLIHQGTGAQESYEINESAIKKGVPLIRGILHMISSEIPCNMLSNKKYGIMERLSLDIHRPLMANWGLT